TFEQDRPVISTAGRNLVAAASGRFLPAVEMTNRGEVERSGGQLATGRGRPRPLPPRCGSVALTAHEQDATVDRDWNRPRNFRAFPCSCRSGFSRDGRCNGGPDAVFAAEAAPTEKLVSGTHGSTRHSPGDAARTVASARRRGGALAGAKVPTRGSHDSGPGLAGEGASHSQRHPTGLFDMRIKRFTAPDMRTALRMVRDEQGPDAVILSTRTSADGVGIEVVAATDYD